MNTTMTDPEVRVVELEASMDEHGARLATRTLEVDLDADADLLARLADLERLIVYLTTRSYVPSDRLARDAFERIRRRLAAGPAPTIKPQPTPRADDTIEREWTAKAAALVAEARRLRVAAEQLADASDPAATDAKERAKRAEQAVRAFLAERPASWNAPL